MKDFFTDDDIKKYTQFDEFIAKYARWLRQDNSGLDTSELAKVFQCLAWFSTLKPKMANSILEIKSVKQVNKPENQEVTE